MCSFKIGRPRLRGLKNVGRRWTRGVGGLEYWTVFMGVICVSSLTSTAPSWERCLKLYVKNSVKVYKIEEYVHNF